MPPDQTKPSARGSRRLLDTIALQVMGSGHVEVRGKTNALVLCNLFDCLFFFWTNRILENTKKSRVKEQ